MKQYQIERRLMAAIDMIRMNDNYLLVNDCNERTICHRLAVYLEGVFKEYNIDCEFNKNGIDPKRLTFYQSSCSYETLVYPDIIVHKRGDNSNNLLAIEVKKSTNQTPRESDYEKLKIYTNSSESGLGYNYGVFIEFYINKEKFSKPEIKIFKDGKRVQFGRNSRNYINRWS